MSQLFATLKAELKQALADCKFEYFYYPDFENLAAQIESLRAENLLSTAEHSKLSKICDHIFANYWGIK